MLGLRHIVCAKEDWYYLVFYDIDKNNELSTNDLKIIDNIMAINSISYMIIKTKHGYHIIGLTPIAIIKHATVFMKLKTLFNSYYSGDVIRLSLKEGEHQELVMMELSYGEVIPNLYNLYAKRFNYEKRPWIKETSKYLLVFEKYRSLKE
jgi:hypothetical protein